MAEADASSQKLKKELGLVAVFAISTGAMFSSGFFLLPGLATAYAGPSTVLAYLLAGLLMIPGLFSVSELSTALPRAGGTYFFIDRSLGPLAGTIGGLGTWMALVLKSGFALLGMGAYLAIFIPGGDAPWFVKGVAVTLTVVFAAVNIFGAKETAKLQVALVAALVGVLAFFVVQGLFYLFTEIGGGELVRRYTPLLKEYEDDKHPGGIGGVATTIGMVIVSYAGLTKVASVSEEVRRPDRNLPLGMFLSLIVATTIYVVGVFIMIAVVPADVIRSDLTPVYTAAADPDHGFFTWLPWGLGGIMIVAAAIAAFVTTGNAGILAASRYPLAMARDRLVLAPFGKLGKFGTPSLSIIVTAVVMAVLIVALPTEGVAKLASAFNLLIFAMLNISVIVMRESRIESYDPGFRSPLYPWMQIAGVLIYGWLIVQMGWLSIAFCAGVAAFGLLWYFYYARHRVSRDGAIYHWFERLGHHRYEALDSELREIMKEKGVRERDPFNDVISRAQVVDLDEAMRFEDVADRVAKILAKRVPGTVEQIAEEFKQGTRLGVTPVTHGAALPHVRRDGLEHPELVLVRSRPGVEIIRGPAGRKADADAEVGKAAADGREPPAGRPPARQIVHALFFLCSPERDPGQHLRILAEIASRVDEEAFMGYWNTARSQQDLKELLLRDERFLGICARRGGPAEAMVGRVIASLDMPSGCLIALIRRGDDEMVPTGSTQIKNGDRLTIIGEPRGIRTLKDRYTTAVERGGPKDKDPGEDEDEDPGEGEGERGGDNATDGDAAVQG